MIQQTLRGRAAAFFVFTSLLNPLWSAPYAAAETQDQLVVGLTGKYPPFNFFDSSGTLTGFDVEVARELCREIGRTCVFRTLQWDGILSALLAGKIDVVIGSMAVTEERSRQVSFTTPYYESGAQLFVSPDAPDPTTPGFRLGVTLGTTYGAFAQEKFPEASVRTYKGDVEILSDLENGRLDGMITDRLVGLHMLQSYGAKIAPKGEPLFLERIAIPVAPGRKELLDALNSAIARIRSSDAYESTFSRYFGGTIDHRTEFSWGPTARLLFDALMKTLKVSLTGILAGTLGAALIAFLLLAPIRLISAPMALLVDFIRATPFLVQLFVIYFGLPAIGIRFDAWTSAVIAIAIHSSAYLAEIIKTAYQAVPASQRVAAHALGLTPYESLRHVVLPQMFPLLTAPTLNTVVAMIKDSAIVSVISVHELTMQTQQLISATFRPMEFYLIAAALYFLITYPLLFAGRRLERRFRKGGLLHA